MQVTLKSRETARGQRLQRPKVVQALCTAGSLHGAWCSAILFPTSTLDLQTPDPRCPPVLSGPLTGLPTAGHEHLRPVVFQPQARPSAFRMQVWSRLHQPLPSLASHQDCRGPASPYSFFPHVPRKPPLSLTFPWFFPALQVFFLGCSEPHSQSWLKLGPGACVLQAAGFSPAPH